MPVNAQAKFTALDNLTAQLVAGIQTLGAREQMVEAVVEQQAAVQPKQEGIIEDAFMQLGAKISRGATLAKSFDGSKTAIRAHDAVPFTLAMSLDMKSLREEFAQMPKHISAEIARITDPMNHMINEARLQGVSHDLALSTVENKLISLETDVNCINSLSESPLGAPPGYGVTCVSCAPTPASVSPWGHSPTAVQGATGQASSSGVNDPLGVIRAAIGGNGICHCIHVKELLGRVDKLEAVPRTVAATFVPDPWSRGAGAAAPGAASGPTAGPTAPAGLPDLPLRLTSPLGSVGYKDRPIFDQKMTLQEEFKFNGSKDAYKWKTKVHGYFITCAPVLMDIFKWAEKMNMTPIKNETFNYAVSRELTEDQAANLNTQLWGFLGAVVSGSAQTMFLRADESIGEMNGIDAWRRLIRHIDHGLDLRLDDLKHEMKLAHMRPMKTLHEVEAGVAAFENSFYEFVQAGGTQPVDRDMKNDLLRMLPEKMQLDLMWNASEESMSFSQFRDLVVAKSAKVLNIQKPRRGIHQIAEEPEPIFARPPEGMETSELAMFEGVTNADELVAAFQNFQAKKNGGNGGKFQQ